MKPSPTVVIESMNCDSNSGPPHLSLPSPQSSQSSSSLLSSSPTQSPLRHRTKRSLDIDHISNPKVACTRSRAKESPAKRVKSEKRVEMAVATAKRQVTPHPASDLDRQKGSHQLQCDPCHVEKTEPSTLLNRDIEITVHNRVGKGYSSQTFPGYGYSQITLEGCTQHYSGARDADIDDESGNDKIIAPVGTNMGIFDTNGSSTSQDMPSVDNQRGHDFTLTTVQSKSADENLVERVDENSFDNSKKSLTLMNSNKLKQKPSESICISKKKRKNPILNALMEEYNLSENSEDVKVGEDNLGNGNGHIKEVKADEGNDFEDAEIFCAGRNITETSITDDNTQSPVPINSLSKHEIIIRNYEAIENIGKALSCPICCHSIRKATFLPCAHAFCESCISRAFLGPINTASASTKRMRKDSKTIITKMECPVCRLKCGRRSMSRIEQLDDIVIAFKEMTRAFGFTPLVHSSRVQMTQLSPPLDELSDDDEKSQKALLKHRKMCTIEKTVSHSHLRQKRIKIDDFEAIEQNQVARSNRDAFANMQNHLVLNNNSSQKKTSSGKHLSKRELECRAKSLRYQNLQKDLDAVVQVNEEALKKAIGKKKLVEQYSLSLNPSFSSTSIGVTAATCARKFASEEEDDLKSEVFKAAVVHTECLNTAGQTSEHAQRLPKDAFSDISRELASTEMHEDCSDTFTAKDPFQAPEQTVTLGQKSERTSMLRQTKNPLHRINLHSLENAITSKNLLPRGPGKSSNGKELFANKVISPIMLQDGNIRKCHSGSSQSAELDRKLESFKSVNNDEKTNEGVLNDDLNFETRRSKSRPLEVMRAMDKSDFDKSSQISSVVSAVNEQDNFIIVNDETREPKDESVTVGSLVLVQSRTWPGINKPGGVGRVTKVELTGNSAKYDIAYILGGREKNVDEVFLSLYQCNKTHEENVRQKKETPRPVYREKFINKSKPIIAAPIYNDEELQHIPLNVLEWAGIPRPKTIEKTRNTNFETAKEVKLDRHKKVFADSHTNVAGQRKKKSNKINTDDLHFPTKIQVRKNEDTRESFKDVARKMSTTEILRSADARYSSLISSDITTLKIITSSLSETETELLHALRKVLRQKNVSLNIMKDFKLGKTQLCITPAADNSQHTNLISKCRTLKVMRSTLAGLPLLTPLWIETCLQDEKILVPTSQMCILTLQMKKSNESNLFSHESYGVAKHAAVIHQASANPLLSGVSVFLCGTWKASGGSTITMIDLKTLLNEAGANIMTSTSMAFKKLVEISRGENGFFVFLCDDSNYDVECAIPGPVLKKFENAISSADFKSEERILTVHFHWLFDCITCATILSAAAYEPLAPCVKKLWKLGVEKRIQP